MSGVERCSLTIRARECRRGGFLSDRKEERDGGVEERGVPED